MILLFQAHPVSCSGVYPHGKTRGNWKPQSLCLFKESFSWLMGISVKWMIPHGSTDTLPCSMGFYSFLWGEWNPQTLPDCCCFQRLGCCSAEFNSDVLKLQREKSTIKLTWKGLLIPTCGYVFWRESAIKWLIFCVPAARFKPSLLVGFCCVPKSRLMFMTYSLTLGCIILALLGCAGV